MMYNNQQVLNNNQYLELLARQFPTVQSACTEIINLQAILNLPKGTEHFLSDLHGEHEAFLHMLKNGSGVVRRKIDVVFKTTEMIKEKNLLATLIYYPDEVLEKAIMEKDDIEDWYKVTLNRLVLVCREVSSKYTRSKVRKALPKDYTYIIEELLHVQEDVPNKYKYYDQIIDTIIQIGQAYPFIRALCQLIQRLAIDRLHIIGDIYDRGPGAHIIMDKLKNYHSVDIQWGNHDIHWIGAACGSEVCIANTIRISARYGHLDILEEGYGINLLPLAKYALETYEDVEDTFLPVNPERFTQEEIRLISQIQKAVAIIMFKLEGQIIQRNPNYELENRLLLHKIDYNSKTIEIEGVQYEMQISDLPSINKDNPYELSIEEKKIMQKLKKLYLNNEKLKSHIDFMISKGSIYLVHNNNLLYHGCIPMDDNGEFSTFKINNKSYQGKELLDELECMVRWSYMNRHKIKDQRELDFFWYLWTGRYSSLFGKLEMKTFERYFLIDKETHKEIKNPYYKNRDNQEVCLKILKDFGLTNDQAKIINGHVPVEVTNGENPVKANGKLIVIDGGLSKAYQKVTGIAGYTLIYNSHGMLLAAHEPFESTKCAIEKGEDIISTITVLENSSERILVSDTDTGEKIKQDIEALKCLLEAYKKGVIKVKTIG